MTTRGRTRSPAGTHDAVDTAKETIMQDVTVTDRGNTTLLVSPYNKDIPAEAKRIGGRWNPTLRAWEFDIRDHDKVEQLAARFYGYTPADTGETVTIRVNAYDYVPDDYREYDKIVVAGRGGSRNSPCIIGDNGDRPDPVLEIRDLPAGALTLLDRENKPYEPVDGDPRRALREERERLTRRLAEIDRLLAA